MKLLGFGDNIFDCYLSRGELYPGGNAANVSVLAKRAGAKESAYIGALALDAAGRHFYDALRAEGVDVARVRRAEGKTACNYIAIDEQGDRLFTGNNGDDTVQHTLRVVLTSDDLTLASSCDVAHTSIHSCLEDELPALSRAVDLSMDFSSDGFTHVNVKRLAPFLRFAFFSSGGRERSSMEDFILYAATCGIEEVVCTLGVHGSFGISKGEIWETNAAPVEVTDALGAGDAYCAAFLVDYYENGGDASRAAARASFFAAENCKQFGAFGRPFPLPDDASA